MTAPDPQVSGSAPAAPTPTTGRCPACGTPSEAADQFCEACGAPLGDEASIPPPVTAATTHTDATSPTSESIPTAPARPPGTNGACIACGAPSDAIGKDGFCTACGHRQPSPRDHQEIDLGRAAGVTDRGRIHSRNEDAFYLTVSGDSVVAVVCDGVSTSVAPDAASEAAVIAAGRVLASTARIGNDRPVQATVDAMAAAQTAVVAVEWLPEGRLASPSCTFVSALCGGNEVAVGWIGDSRAYWVTGDGARQLTADNSWAEEQIEAGMMTAAEAEESPLSHAITRWVGPDAPEGADQVATFRPEQPGRVLVCSDGLWNYAPTAATMAELMTSMGMDASPIQLARALTSYALEAGGHDNITVVVIDVAAAAVMDDCGPEKGKA